MSEPIHQPAWERLSAALQHVMDATSMAKDEAKGAICQAIADRSIRIRGCLGKHKRSMTSKAVLDGKDFQIPTKIKPKHFDWDSSRPLQPWFVHRGRYALPGYWDLAWIEVCRADVEKILCPRLGEIAGPHRMPVKTNMAGRSRPTRDRAYQAIQALYPEGVPDPMTLPNALLCRRIGQWLKERGLPGISDDTMLRVTGRRRK
jgi:hypothetical protein